MLKINKVLLIIVVVWALLLLINLSKTRIFASQENHIQTETGQHECESCDPKTQETEDSHDPENLHDHEMVDGRADEDAHDEHDHELISLDPESRNLIEIKTVKAQTGSLVSAIHLTGQIRLNENHLAHIVPLTSGIVRQVNKNVGDAVKKNEVLAWIESTELAQAKVKYLDIQAEIGCCSLNLTRAQQIHDNTLKLIEFLRTNPTLDDLQEMNVLEMGENQSVLIKAYAEYVIAQSVYNREKPLYEQKISSLQEFQKAENQFKKAQAEYRAALDTIQFQIKQNLLEALGQQRRQEIALKGAERILYVLGQTQDDILKLDRIALNSVNTPTVSTACPDPNCEECQKTAEKTKDVKILSQADLQYLGWYPLRAAFDGTIINKHMTLGERVSEDTTVFTIADLDTVWVDLQVFPKDLPHVRTGGTVFIACGNQYLKGAIHFVSPVLDPQTRTVTARIILGNPDGTLRPGQFVTSVLNGDRLSDRIIVPLEAVQTIDGNKCVFVRNGSEYEPRNVTVGYSDSRLIEITSGLGAGEDVVTTGAFDLKAKIVTSSLDSHAGHGH